MIFKKPFHNRNKVTDIEHVSGWQNTKVVDSLSFVPFQERIKALLASGQVLANHRSELYDFVPRKDPITGDTLDMSNEEFDSVSPVRPMGDFLDTTLEVSEICRHTLEEGCRRVESPTVDTFVDDVKKDAINASSVANMVNATESANAVQTE